MTLHERRLQLIHCNTGVLQSFGTTESGFGFEVLSDFDAVKFGELPRIHLGQFSRQVYSVALP